MNSVSAEALHGGSRPAWRLASFVMILSSAAPGVAQGELVQDTEAAEEIVVTGTREQGYRATVAPQVNKSDTPLQQTPFSVQVVTRELIEDRGVTTLGEALRYVPGLSPQVGFGASNDRFTIRGFTVPFNYKNGFRRGGFATNDQLANIEQIEILKGPASALYGRAETGGVVNIVTKRPARTVFLDLTGEYGSFEALRLTADANLPLSDTLGARLNASYDDRESYRDFVFSREWLVAPVVRWHATPSTSFTVEGEYADRHAFFDRGFGNNPIFLRAPRDRQFGNKDARQDREAGIISAFVDHRFSDALSGRVAAAFSESSIDGLYYAYGFPAVIGATGPNPQINVRPTRTFDRQRNFTAQAELYGRFATGPVEHKLLVGAEQGHDDWDYFYRAAPAVQISFNDPVYSMPAAQGPFTTTLDGGPQSKAAAAYAQDEIALGRIRLLVGGRFDWNKTTMFDRVGGPDPALTRKESSFSPRAGLTWTPVPAVSLYASWSRSFLPQHFGRLRGGGLPTVLKGRSLEAGVKLNLLNGRVRPTLAVFDIERIGAAVSDPEDFNYVIQIGKSRTRGIELDVPAAITPRWRVIASYAHLDAEVVNDSSIAPGTRLINAPDHSASLWTTYDVPGALEGLSVGAGALYIGERTGNSNGTIKLPGYTRVDANLAYAFKAGGRPFKAQLNVLNLFDKFYYDSGGAFLPVYPGAPRTISVSLSYLVGGGRR